MLVISSLKVLIALPRHLNVSSGIVEVGIRNLAMLVRLVLLRSGLKYLATIGIMHDRESDRGSYPAFALDHMEPMRPVVDRAILQLVRTETFSGADFSIQHDGVCRLHPELARRIAQAAIGALSGG